MLLASARDSVRMAGMKSAFIVLVWVGLAGTAAGQSGSGGFDEQAWAAGITAQRKARNDEFRSRDWSALAVVAIAPLGRQRLVLGSGGDADLRLESPDVAAAHAELIRTSGKDGKPTVRVRALDGSVWSTGEKPAEVRDLALQPDARVRIGRFLVYWNNFSTFGPVVRVLDFESEAFTRFDGLSYFAPDPAYRVVADVRPFAHAERVLIGDTQGWRRPAWRYGEASFTLKGRSLKVVLFLLKAEPAPDDTFFIAFSDRTSGRETYPAARYLTPAFVRSGPLVLDFNLASNPLCAYNAGFACPLPPRENRIPIEIRAGEKLYPHAAGHH